MDHRGIGAVASAVTLLLQRSWSSTIIDAATPEFAVYRAPDFAKPMRCGLSVFVTHVSVPLTSRNPPRFEPAYRSGVSVEVSFIVTAWGESASVEHSLFGWGACILADTPLLDSALLNDAAPGVCAVDETVQLRTLGSERPVSELWRPIPCGIRPSLFYTTSEVQLEIQR